MKKNRSIFLAIIVIMIILFGSMNFIVTSMSTSFTITTSTEKGLQKDYNSIGFGTNVNYISYSTSQTKKIKIDSDSSTTELKSNVKLKYIDDTSIGLTRFLPFYKPVRVNSKIHYQWAAEVWKNNRKSLLKSQNILNLEGHANIKGFCSANHASKLIMKSVKDQIEKEIKKDIDNQISNLN